MRRLLAILLIAGSGCCGYTAPTPDELRRIPLFPPTATASRVRVHVSLDSRWLAGEFDGVIVAAPGIARIQLFGDLGPKMIDLLARPDRIAGYFPQTREGIDAAPPEKASPHPLLFLGIHLLEVFAGVGEERVLGTLPGEDGWWLDLKPVIPGMRSEAFVSRGSELLERRFRWMAGVSWTERRENRDTWAIQAPGLTLRVRVLSTETVEPRPAKAFEFELPGDVRVLK